MLQVVLLFSLWVEFENLTLIKGIVIHLRLQIEVRPWCGIRPGTIYLTSNSKLGSDADDDFI